MWVALVSLTAHHHRHPPQTREAREAEVTPSLDLNQPFPLERSLYTDALSACVYEDRWQAATQVGWCGLEINT